jgi:hypothetical protein
MNVVVAPRPIMTKRGVDHALSASARMSFAMFRSVIRPEMLWGWWIDDVARQLQQFYEDFAAGKRPKLALMAPPQHGKSWAVTDFIAWCAGKNPDKKTIFGSYSDDLGTRTNKDIQRIMSMESYADIFPDLSIGNIGWQQNTRLIEYPGHAGSFRNTTISGPINGMELHLGVIDDPLKGRAEAYSKLIRDKTWDWFVDDFLSRFAKDGALLIALACR